MTNMFAKGNLNTGDVSNVGLIEGYYFPSAQAQLAIAWHGMALTPPLTVVHRTEDSPLDLRVLLNLQRNLGLLRITLKGKCNFVLYRDNISLPLAWPSASCGHP